MQTKRYIFLILIAFLTFVSGTITYFFFHNFTAVKSEAFVSVAPLKTADVRSFQIEGNVLPQKPEYLDSIEMLASWTENQRTEKEPSVFFENLSSATVDYEADLSETVYDRVIILHPFLNDSREFKVERQFETSMALSDEGPHLDMTDWKHYTSNWQELEKIESNKFLASKISEADGERFPKVTRKEIYDAVLKDGGKRWANYSKTCKTVNDGPCYVAISRISFRIKAKEKGQWKIIHRINFSVPMGC